MALGNHDDREHFRAVVPADDDWQASMPQRQAMIVPSPHANWFMLDSLKVTDKTPGLLGEEQLAWLAKSLDTHADKPALVMTHHDLYDGPKGTTLEDADALMDVLIPRKHVKAYVYGHTHVWRRKQRDGLHLVNLPANAWVFNPQVPNGWVDVNLRPDGATFQLHALKPEHPSDGEKFNLQWR
jgi:3',5'-cyclic-AMP phosphodiesterase